MYDVHGTEQDFSNTFNPNDIDPNQIFQMFFQQSGGNPFGDLFGGGSAFTMYSNMGGQSRSYRSGGGQRQRANHQQQQFAGGNIFDVFNQMQQPGRPQRRRTNQQHPMEQNQEEPNVFNFFQNQRTERARNNRAAHQNKTPGEAILVNVLNQCMP
jgi:hypothetical protein